jgi:hypothetical protein
MLRKTLTILSLIGLLLSVGAWGASYFQVYYMGDNHGLSLAYGAVRYTFWPRPIPYGPDDERALQLLNVRGPEGLRINGFIGFRTIWIPEFDVVPLWIPTVVFGAYPVYMILPLHRRRKRKKLGLCLKCGYDLRASKDRCPECGTEFSA